jgi:hypothetical protein
MLKEGATPARTLTKKERERFQQLELTVNLGRRAFESVVTALAEIHDRKLYREDYPSWEQYLADQWGWSRAHGYRMLEHAKVVDVVSPSGEIPNERQARELAPLARTDPVQAKQVWETLTADGETVTANQVRAAVRGGPDYTVKRSAASRPSKHLDRDRPSGESQQKRVDLLLRVTVSGVVLPDDEEVADYLRPRVGFGREHEESRGWDVIVEDLLL